MPELHSYQADPYNQLADFQSGEHFLTPLSDFLSAKFERALEYGQLVLGSNNPLISSLNTQQDLYKADTLEPVQNPLLSADAAEARYGIKINADQRISDLAAQKLSELAQQDDLREEIINHASQDLGTQIIGFLATVAGRMLDPVTVIGCIVIGLCSKSLKQVLLASIGYGLAIIAIFYLLIDKSSIGPFFVEIEVAQLVACPLLSITLFFGKKTWIHFKKPNASIPQNKLK